MTGAPVEVRVGIVSYQTAELLDACLTALPAALDGLTAEIVVVDNASTDASVEVAERHPGVQVRRSATNVGYARGMNRALADADAEVLVALNPDTLPPPGSLARLVQRLRARPEVALVAPRLADPDGSTQHSVYRFPSLRLAAAVNLLPAALHRGALARRLWLEGRSSHTAVVEVDWAIGAVHVIRAAALDATIYRERWFMYVEDLDLCWRLRRAGWRVLLDGEVTVPHVGNAAGAQAFGDRRRARWWRETYDWYALERGTLQARLYAALNLLGTASRWLTARWGARRGPRSGTHRFRARTLRGDLAVHVTALWRPAGPEGPPR